MNRFTVVLVVAALAVNSYRVVAGTGYSQWTWLAGFAAGCAWCAYWNWFLNSEEYDEAGQRLDARPLDGEPPGE